MAKRNVSSTKSISARLIRLVRFTARSNPSLPVALSGAAIAALLLLGTVVGVGRLVGLVPAPRTIVAAARTGAALAARTAQRRMDRLAGDIATLEIRLRRLQSDNRMVSDRLATVESDKRLASGGLAGRPAGDVSLKRETVRRQPPAAGKVATLENRLKRLQSDNARLSRRLAMIESDNQITTGSIARRPTGTASMKRGPVRKQRPAAGGKGGFSPPSEAAAPSPETSLSRLVPTDVRRSSDVASRTWFALRLGSYATLDGLAAIWRRLEQSHGALLVNLEPRSLAGRPVDGTRQFDLIAGPLANAAAAAELCARFKANGSACEIARFGGERLATGQH